MSTQSKSEQIRQMYFEQGLKKGQIAKTLGIRFQFVYNVVAREETKKELELLRKGKQG